MYLGPLGVAKLTNDLPGHSWDAVIMVAIAGAESSWRTDATSATNDYGIWQINNQAWPGLFSKYNWWDPHDNLLMMDHVWGIQGYHAWTTYWQGQYLAYMDQARNAVAQAGGQGYGGGSGTPPGGGGGGAPADIPGAMQQVAHAIQTMADQDLYWSRIIDTLW